MTLCSDCEQNAVFSNPSYCKPHFFIYIEKKVKETIEKFNLIEKEDAIAVALSGGKDSQTVSYILNKLYPNKVSAIAIDEGIPGYRDNTIKDLKQFCEYNKIRYKIASFKESFGTTTADVAKKMRVPCRVCGILRRNLLNLHSEGFNKLATGHNLDDECQNIIMNLLKGNTELSARLGPMSGIMEREGLTRRIKPLYFCTEKEIAAYAFLKNFPVRFSECPYTANSFRSNVRDALNEAESQNPGTKQKIAERFILMLPQLKERSTKSALKLCKYCRSPTAGEYCGACNIIKVLKNAI